MSIVRTGMLAAALAVASACGKGGGDTGGTANTAVAESETSAVAATAPDACTFIPKAELEGLVGYELRDGEKKDVPQGESQCDFEKPAGMYVTRKFDNPPLPEAAGFSSLVVTTYPTTAKTFAEGRELLGDQGSDVAGIGDGAYLIGPNLLHVRKGDRGFSVRAYVDEPKTDAGREVLRKVMTSLGQAGAAKL